MTKEVQHELGSARLPRNYRAVYAVLCDLGLGEHAGAGEIYVAARKRQPTIGYSTVYRALERLTTLGLITEVRVPGAQSILYEPVRAAHAAAIASQPLVCAVVASTIAGMRARMQSSRSARSA